MLRVLWVAALCRQQGPVYLFSRPDIDKIEKIEICA